MSKTSEYFNTAFTRNKTKYFFTYYYNFIFFNLNAFPITDTELKLIAKAAIIGDKRIPKTGNNTPAAIGIPKIL